MPTIFVKPVTPETSVPFPNSASLLPVEGQAVPHDAYWRRRIAKGDVIVVEEPKTNTQETSPEAGGSAKGNKK